MCLVVTRAPEEARFFVLERTQVPEEREDAAGRAVLCEWLEGGRRRNHQLVIRPEPGPFLAEVERALDEEETRRRAAAPAVRVETWNVAEGEHPLEAMLALHGALKDAEEATFMNALSLLDASRSLPAPDNALAHLVFYPRIAQAAEQALPDIPLRPDKTGSR